MTLHRAVGVNCPNLKTDVVLLQKRLIQIKKSRQASPSGELDEETFIAITSVQRHFMRCPDGIVSPEGWTLKYLNRWSPKKVAATANIGNARLRQAWSLVSPLLPIGSYCSSGYRSKEKQREILQDFFFNTDKAAILAACGQAEYDKVSKAPVENEQRMLELVRGAGVKIAAPGRSMHERYKAIDIGGGRALHKAQAAIVKIVANANPHILSGHIVLERKQCVHFELK